jgi:hypothetical protein
MRRGEFDNWQCSPLKFGLLGVGASLLVSLSFFERESWKCSTRRSRRGGSGGRWPRRSPWDPRKSVPPGEHEVAAQQHAAPLVSFEVRDGDVANFDGVRDVGWVPSLPRGSSVTPGGLVYHVLNRSVAGLPWFRKRADYETFERIMIEAHRRHPLPILAWCLMRTH